MIWAPIGEDRNLLYALGWNSAQDAKFAFDANDGIVLDMNPAAEALLGCSRDAIVGKHGALLHPPEERQKIRSIIRHGSGEAGKIADLHVLRADGQRVPVTISNSDAWTLAGRMVVICVFRDITDQLEKERRLAAQNWALAAYADAAIALGRARTPESLLQAICDAIARKSVFLGACVLVAEDDARKSLRLLASAGVSSGQIGADQSDVRDLSWAEDTPVGQGPTGICIRTGQLQIVADSETAPVDSRLRDIGRRLGIRSSISIPLRVENGWRGALVVYADRPHAFEAPAVEVFERLAEEIVHGIHALDQNRLLRVERQNLARTQAELTMALSSMVAPIVSAMEMRDPYTAGHQTRVAEIACAMAAEIGWPDDQIYGLKVASLVHDIGKISIPSEILTKPGKLNPAEWSMISQHPETGYSILKDIPFAWPVADIVRQHHERLDGSGYPLGLKGDDILPEARLLAVADEVEAMAAYRPYRPGIELDFVLKHIESEAGTKLDPMAVESCVSLFRDRKFTLPGWVGSSADNPERTRPRRGQTSLQAAN